jgi:hypothetical protein
MAVVWRAKRKTPAGRQRYQNSLLLLM